MRGATDAANRQQSPAQAQAQAAGAAQLPLAAAKAAFLAKEVAYERLAAPFDELRSSEYAHLDEGRRACLSYSGVGLFSHAQQADEEIAYQTLPSFNFNFVSSGGSLSLKALENLLAKEEPLEKELRERVAEFLQAPQRDYHAVLVPSSHSALQVSTPQDPLVPGTAQLRKPRLCWLYVASAQELLLLLRPAVNPAQLLLEVYPFTETSSLFTVYDHPNKGIEPLQKAAAAAGAALVTPKISWPDLVVNGRDLSRLLCEEGKAGKDGIAGGPAKGLFVLPVQSEVTGAKERLDWLATAAQQGWHTLLDATAASPGEELCIALHRPHFVVASFYKVFGEDSGGFACLLVKRGLSLPPPPAAAASNKGPPRLSLDVLLAKGAAAAAAADDAAGLPAVVATDQESSGRSSSSSSCSSSSSSTPSLASSASRRLDLDALPAAISRTAAAAAAAAVIGERPSAQAPWYFLSSPAIISATSLSPASSISQEDDAAAPTDSAEWVEAASKKPTCVLQRTHSYHNPWYTGPLVCRGLEHHVAMGAARTRRRLACLGDWLLSSLAQLKHPRSQEPLVEIYGPLSSATRGMRLAFNVFDVKGDLIPPTVVQRLASKSQINLSTGAVWAPSNVRLVLSTFSPEIEQDESALLFGIIGQDSGSQARKGALEVDDRAVVLHRRTPSTSQVGVTSWNNSESHKGMKAPALTPTVGFERAAGDSSFTKPTITLPQDLLRSTRRMMTTKSLTLTPAIASPKDKSVRRSGLEVLSGMFGRRKVASPKGLKPWSPIRSRRSHSTTFFHKDRASDRSTRPARPNPQRESGPAKPDSDGNPMVMPVVSIAFGLVTNFEDVYNLWAFVAHFLDADFAFEWKGAWISAMTCEKEHGVKYLSREGDGLLTKGMRVANIGQDNLKCGTALGEN
eukprot:SM000105S13895  [mRNA]  locus=s105:450396:459348:+ [translate_table: standard]